MSVIIPYSPVSSSNLCQWRCLMPGFLKLWMRGIRGLKFSIWFLISMATFCTASISANTLMSLTIILYISVVDPSMESASMFSIGLSIHISYDRNQSRIFLYKNISVRKHAGVDLISYLTQFPRGSYRVRTPLSVWLSSRKGPRVRRRVSVSD